MPDELTQIIGTVTGPLKTFLSALPWIGLSIVILIGTAYLMRWYLTHRRMNISTIIFSKRGGVVNTKAALMWGEADAKGKYKPPTKNPIKLFKLLFTKGGYFFIKGNWFYKLKSPRVTISCPTYDHLIPLRKGNLLFLRQESMDDFIPLRVKLTEKEAIFEAIPEDIKLWAATMKDRLRTIYSKPTWLEKYGAFITIAIVGIIILLLVWVVLNKFGVLKDVANTLRETATILKAKSIELPPTAPA